MPRGERAIGDILRGKRGDVDMSDAEVTRDALEGDLDEDQRRALKTATTAETTFTPPDLDPARRLLFGWSLRRFLDTRPPSTVVTVSRTATVGEARPRSPGTASSPRPCSTRRTRTSTGFCPAWTSCTRSSTGWTPR